MAASGERLRLGPIVRDVLRIYGRHWRLLVPLAVIVLLPQVVADAILGDVEIDSPHSFGDFARLATLPATVAVNLAGEALYAGIVAAVVVHWRRGDRLPGVRAVARELPLGRLVAADFVVAVGTAAGFLVLVVPGVVFFTYFALTPALIELRRLRLGEALATSVRLVRGHFWHVLAFALAVLVLTDLAGAALGSPIHGVPGEIALDIAIEAALQPFQGLATVLLALALLDLSGKRSPNP